MPNVVISAHQLHLIPRSHPEELNNMSLLDRLNRMEKKMADLQLNTDRVIAENIAINERLNNQSSYASVAQSKTPSTTTAKDMTGSHTLDNPGKFARSEVPLHVNPPPIRRHPNLPVKDPINQNRSTDDKFKLPPQVKSPSNDPVLKHLNATPEIDCVSMTDSAGFQFPKRRKRNIVVGKDKSVCAVKGAPEPNRDVFIYRVDKTTSDASLYDYLINKGITPYSLDCVSNPDARYKSYKLSIPLSMYGTLHDPDMWPEGIRIRRFYIPKNNNNGQSNSS